MQMMHWKGVVPRDQQEYRSLYELCLCLCLEEFHSHILPVCEGKEKQCILTADTGDTVRHWSIREKNKRRPVPVPKNAQHFPFNTLKEAFKVLLLFLRTSQNHIIHTRLVQNSEFHNWIQFTEWIVLWIWITRSGITRN